MSLEKLVQMILYKKQKQRHRYRKQTYRHQGGGSGQDELGDWDRHISTNLCIKSEKAMTPHSSSLAWKIHGRRSLESCGAWGCCKSDTTERLHFHFSLSCIGEGNGNPLQCSCLETPRDGGAWSAAVYGVAQSWTRLK